MENLGYLVAEVYIWYISWFGAPEVFPLFKEVSLDVKHDGEWMFNVLELFGIISIIKVVLASTHRAVFDQKLDHVSLYSLPVLTVTCIGSSNTTEESSFLCWEQTVHQILYVLHVPVSLHVPVFENTLFNYQNVFENYSKII